MNRRRKYIIDKRFQLRTAISVLSVTGVLSIIILLALVLSAVYNNKKVRDIIRSEDRIFQALTVSVMENNNDVQVDKKINSMSNDHIFNFYMSNKIMNYNRILMLAVLLVIIIQGVIIYGMMIKKTHRISGPVYLMSNYLKEMMQGKYPDTRSLRKKDELMDFYNLFTQFIAQLKERDKKKK